MLRNHLYWIVLTWLVPDWAAFIVICVGLIWLRIGKVRTLNSLQCCRILTHQVVLGGGRTSISNLGLDASILLASFLNQIDFLTKIIAGMRGSHYGSASSFDRRWFLKWMASGVYSARDLVTWSMVGTSSCRPPILAGSCSRRTALISESWVNSFLGFLIIGGLLEISEFNFDLLQNLASVIVFGKFMILLDWVLQKSTQSWNQFANNSLSLSLKLFHAEIFLLHLVKFALKVEQFFLLMQFSLLVQRLILGEQPFGFVVNEIAQDLKRVLLLDLFAFEKFSHFGHSLSYVLNFSLFFFSNQRTFRTFSSSFFQRTLAFFKLIFDFLNHFDQFSSLRDQLLIRISLIFKLIA